MFSHLERKATARHAVRVTPPTALVHSKRPLGQSEVAQHRLGAALVEVAQLRQLTQSRPENKCIAGGGGIFQGRGDAFPQELAVNDPVAEQPAVTLGEHDYRQDDCAEQSLDRVAPGAA